MVNTASDGASAPSESHGGQSADGSPQSGMSTDDAQILAASMDENSVVDDMVTIDTPNGPVQVSPETLEREGKDNVLREIADIQAEMDAHPVNTSDIPAASDVSLTSPASGVKASDGQMAGIPDSVAVAPASSAPMSTATTYEKATFARRNANYYPTALYGIIDPQTVYSTGQNYTSTSQRIIYLGNGTTHTRQGDYITIYSRQNSAGGSDILMTLTDGSVLKWNPGIAFYSIKGPCEYVVTLNSSTKTYSVMLTNLKTGASVYRSYLDSTYSSYIDGYAGETTLSYNALTKWFHSSTCIEDTLVKVGSRSYTPNEIFYLQGYGADQPYINMYTHTDNLNRTYTLHYCDYPGCPNPPYSGELLMNMMGHLSGTGDSNTYPIVSGPEGHPQTLTVVIVGDEQCSMDLYAKWGSPPTMTSYDAKATSGNSLKHLTTSGISPLYIMVVSKNGGCSWTSCVIEGSPYVDSGIKTSVLSPGGSELYTIPRIGGSWVFAAGPSVGEGYHVNMKWNSPPTNTSYDYRLSREYGGIGGGYGTLYSTIYADPYASGSSRYEFLALQFQ